MHATLYFVLVSAALVYGKTTFVRVPSELLPNMLNKSMECVGKTGIDTETMQKILTWKFEDTESTRKYIYCFVKSIGYVDDDGHLVKDRIMKLAANDKNFNELSKVIDECNLVRGSSNEETVFKKAVCFHEKSPILFTL